MILPALLKKIQKAFTLMELLVVLLIIGIFSSAIVFQVGDVNRNKAIYRLSDLLKSQMQVARTEALLTTSTLGLEITKKFYLFYKYQSNGQAIWLPLISKDTFWNAYPIPKGLNLLIVSKKLTFSAGPQIIFLPTGEITPAMIYVTSDKSNKQVRLNVMEIGEIDIEEKQHGKWIAIS